MANGTGNTLAALSPPRPGADQIAEALRALADGHSSLIVAGGRPGSGKSSLYRSFGVAAQAAGFTVMRARCAPDETGDDFGVVRQLIEDAPALQAAGGESAAWPTAWTDDEFFRAIAELVVDTPLVILIDDAQWADAASLGAFGYLARRLYKVPVLILMTHDANERTPRWPELADLQRQPDTVVWQFRSLCLEEVAELCAEVQGGPDAALADACMELTQGVPFLVTELLAEAVAIQWHGEPLAETVQRCVSLNVAAAALSRLRPFGPELTAALGSLSVLRTPVRWETAARILDQDLMTAADTIDLFRRFSLLAGDDRIVVWPEYVRRAIINTLTPSERHAAEIAAARILGGQGDPDGTAALHLLSSFPSGDPAHVDVLRAGAEVALRRGTPELAASLLSRALLEPPAAAQIGRVRAELGKAELRFDAASAVISLRAALGAQPDAEAEAEVALALAHALSLAGRLAEVVEVLEPALAAAVVALGPGHELIGRMRAEILFASMGDHGARDRMAEAEASGSAAADAPAGHGPASPATARAVAAPQGLLDAFACVPAAETTRKVAEALAGGLQPSRDASLAGLAAGMVLVWGGELDLAERWYADGYAQAARDGFVVHSSVALLVQAIIHVRRGALPAADACLVKARELVADGQWGRWRLAPSVTEAVIAIARGTSDGLSGTLSEAAMRGSRGAWLGNLLLYCRGRLRVLEDDPHQGLADLLEAGRRFTRIGCKNPEIAPWRSDAALVLARFDERAQAFGLLEEELELARAWGAPGAQAIALRRRGVLRAGSAGLAAVEAALALLDVEQVPLEVARTLRTGAGLLTGPEDREQARTQLARAFELAVDCRAGGLADRIERDLVALGGQSGTLTDCEQRVAALAVDGRTNAEIAKELYISRRTVEVHLTSVYRKLRIRGRGELREALDRARARP